MKYRCEDCECWGPNELTMEVHTGRCHSEYFECGLCDFKAKTKENLEIHLSTCEIYDCDVCYFRVQQISEIKAHVNEKHESINVKIVHGKQSRQNCEEIATTEHCRFNLFPQTN